MSGRKPITVPLYGPTLELVSITIHADRTRSFNQIISINQFIERTEP